MNIVLSIANSINIIIVFEIPKFIITYYVIYYSSIIYIFLYIYLSLLHILGFFSSFIK